MSCIFLNRPRSSQLTNRPRSTLLILSTTFTLSCTFSLKSILRRSIAAIETQLWSSRISIIFSTAPRMKDPWKFHSWWCLNTKASSEWPEPNCQTAENSKTENCLKASTRKISKKTPESVLKYFWMKVNVKSFLMTSKHLFQRFPPFLPKFTL